MKLSTVPWLNLWNKQPVYAPRIEWTLWVTRTAVWTTVDEPPKDVINNPLDKTPPKKSAQNWERPSDISPELWELLKAWKLRKTLWHPADGWFKSPKWLGWAHFWSKKR